MKEDEGRKMTMDSGEIAEPAATEKKFFAMYKSLGGSSDEAEYYAVVTGSAEGLCAQSLATDLGWRFNVAVKTVSSAAKSVAGRRGLGRLRRVELKY